jgi:hypothetical protein
MEIADAQAKAMENRLIFKVRQQSRNGKEKGVT